MGQTFLSVVFVLISNLLTGKDACPTNFNGEVIILSTLVERYISYDVIIMKINGNAIAAPRNGHKGHFVLLK